MKYFLLKQDVFIEHTDLIYQKGQRFLAISLSGSDSQLSLLPSILAELLSLCISKGLSKLIQCPYVQFPLNQGGQIFFSIKGQTVTLRDATGSLSQQVNPAIVAPKAAMDNS